MKLSNGKEVFWVYAAANTETGYKCSTAPDPEPGAVLYISGKQNFIGFSYQRLDSIKGKDGKRYAHDFLIPESSYDDCYNFTSFHF